jgi:CDP-diacylglycerol--glycerol-3-phosphate 3-phosphatidyltransferase
MSILIDTKPHFQRLFRPLTRGLARAGVTANQVTVSSMALSLAAGATVLLRPDAQWPLLLIPAVLLVRLVFNHVDGMLAREHGMKSPLGGMLNELADVIADTALYLPLAVIPGVAAWLVVLAVLLAVISEMTGVVALQIGAERRNDGPMSKKPRGLVFGTVATLLALGAAPGLWLDGVLILLALALALTITNRVRYAVEQAT